MDNSKQQNIILYTLSGLVVITVLSIIAANFDLFGTGAINSTLAKWGPAGALAEIIGLYVFVAKVFFTPKDFKYSLLITYPKSLPNFDITVVEWIEAKIISEDLNENVKIVPSQGGPTFRVHFTPKIIQYLNQRPDEPIELKLMDKKQNKWAVKPFYLTENIQHISTETELQKILNDYGDEEL